MMNPFAPSEVYAAPPVKFTYGGLLYGNPKEIDSSWKTSNLCAGTVGCYRELDEVPFRIEGENLVIGTVYTVEIQYDYLNGTTMGYSDISLNSPILPHVGASGVVFGPAVDDSGSSCGSDTCLKKTLTFTANASDVEIYYDAILSDEAGEFCGGACLSTKLNGGENTPINPNDILQLPSLTLTKTLDVPPGTNVNANDWCFIISPAANGKTEYCIKSIDGNYDNSVTVENLTTTSYTVTESGPTGYILTNLSGTNCTANQNGGATATVAAGTRPTNATCNFTNGIGTGKLLLTKDVVATDLTAITDKSKSFDISINGSQNTVQVVDEESAVEVTLPIGTHTLEEINIPSGYALVNYSLDSDTETDGAQFSITAGGTTAVKVTNKQTGGNLYISKQVLDTAGVESTDPNSVFQFSLSGQGVYNIKDEETKSFTGLLPGTFTLTELSLPSGYEFSHFSEDSDPNLPGAQIAVTNGTDKYVTIYNQEIRSGLSVEKSDDVDPVSAGESFKYTITAKNDGPNTLDDVVITDTLPGDMQLSSVTTDMGTCTPNMVSDSFECNIGDLLDGQIVTVEVTVDVPADMAAGTYENVATITTEEYPTGVPASEETTVVSDYDLLVDKNSSVESITAGDTIGFDYTIKVTNQGPSVSKSIELKDLLPSVLDIESVSADNTDVSCTYPDNNLSCSYLESLAPDESFTITIHVTVPSTVDTQSILNEVEVASDEDLYSDEVSVDIIEQTDLQIEKTVNPASVNAGEEFEYIFTLRNGVNALSDADNLELTDTIPSPLVAESVDDPNCQLDGNDLTCKWDNLAADSEDIVIKVKVSVPADIASTVINNTVLLESDEDEATDNVDVTITEQSGLYVQKRDSADPVVANDGTFNYFIEFGNDGPSVADGVVISDYLPNELEFVSYEVVSSDLSFTCEVGEALIAHPEGFEGRDVLNCSVGFVDVGDSAEIRVTMKVPVDTDATVVNNRVDLESEQEQLSDEEETTIIEDVLLSVTKIDSLETEESAVAGENLTYTIKVRNDGSSDTENVLITDTLPTEVGFVSVDSVQCEYIELGHKLVCTLDKLGAGSLFEFNITVSIPADIAVTQILNSVQVVSDEDSASDEVSSPLEDSVELDIQKRLLSNTPLIPGFENLRFNLEVKNYGPSVAKDVVVTDDLSEILDNLDEEDVEITATTDDGTCNTPTKALPILECELGDLPVYNSEDETTESLIRLRIEIPADYPVGRYSNLASVASANGGSDEDTRTYTISSESELSLTKEALSDQVFADPDNGLVTFRITVVNNGPSIARSVVITDHLPEGFTPENLPSMCQSSSNSLIVPFQLYSMSSLNEVTCQMGDIEVGGSREVLVTAKVAYGTEDGTYTNHAFATSEECTPMEESDFCAEAEDDVAVIGTVDLELDKYDNFADDESAVAGRDEVVYTIELRNMGAPTSGFSELIDYLPDGFTFIQVTDSRCAYYPEDHTVRCRFSGLDSPDELVKFNIRTYVEPWVERGDYTNNVEVTYGGERAEADEITNVIRENQLNLDKEVVSIEGEQIGQDNVVILAGSDDVVFSTRIYNYGPSIATDVRFTDFLSNIFGFVVDPADLNLKIETTKGYCDPVDLEDQLISCYLGDMAPYHPEMNPDPEYVTLTIDMPEYVESNIYFNRVCMSSSETGHQQCTNQNGDDNNLNYDDKEWFEVVRPEPVLSILKSNSYMEDPRNYLPGEVVNFSLVLGAMNAPVFNVVLNDVISKGLTYVPGSLKVNMEDPVLKIVKPMGITLGFLNGVASLALGEIKSGEVVKVTYSAVVNQDATPGTLKDLSWARGTSYSENPVFAQSVDGHFSKITQNVVGTKVVIAQAYTPETGEVLGAATVLPATGTSTARTIAAILMILTGTILMGVAYLFESKKKSSFMKNIALVAIFALLAMSMMSIVLPNEVAAATPPPVLQLNELPLSSDASFDLGYTGVVIEPPISTTCLWKKASDSSWLPVGTSSDWTNVIFNGNCSITSSQITADGEYNFILKGEQNGSVYYSNQVNVVVDLSAPTSTGSVTVQNPTTCSSTISIQVPNDPGIVAVEIFRSTTTPFTVGASNLIATQSATPGQTLVYTDNHPTCGVTYYYATRTVDSANNVSPAAIATTPAVLGAQTGPGTTTTAANAQANVVAQAPEGEVLGEEDADQNGTDDNEDSNGAGSEDEQSGRNENKDNDEKDENNGSSDYTETVEKYYWVFIILGIIFLVSGVYVYKRSKQGTKR